MAGENKENSACFDAMLWVGNASHQWKTVDEFVKEAQLRGCCRKLPFVPGWMKAGETKVFLAHRDKHGTPNRGSIFGYFVLNRIEIITKDQIAQSLFEKKKCGSLWPRDVDHYFESIKGWEDKGLTPGEIKGRLEDELQKSHLPDIAQGKTSKKPRPNKKNQNYIDLVEEILKDLIEEWLNNFPPTYSTSCEGHRGCSLRKNVGSVYAVDALCVAVHDNYQLNLKGLLDGKSKREQRQLLRQYKKENNDTWSEWRRRNRHRHTWKVEELLQCYKGPFREAVEELFSSWKPKNYLDPRLNGKANIHGELIVFKKPYPILERCPQAAYRGIWRIDGDRLIGQIAKHKEKKVLMPRIHSCMEKEHPETKEEIATWLAGELNVNKACGHLFLDKMAKEAYDQLVLYQKFKIPGIGTIRIQGKRAPKKINFFPIKALSDLQGNQKKEM